MRTDNRRRITALGPRLFEETVIRVIFRVRCQVNNVDRSFESINKLVR